MGCRASGRRPTSPTSCGPSSPVTTSYAQLTEALRTVFETIASVELRPFLYAKNKTGVARAVQAVAMDGAAIPDRTGSRPLQLLVECGLVKVRRDLSHTLLAGELAGREQVARLLGAEVTFIKCVHSWTTCSSTTSSGTPFITTR